MPAAIHSINVHCLKARVFSGNECDMWLSDFVKCYGYLLRQPNGHLWLVGGGITKVKAKEIAMQYQQYVDRCADSSIKAQ